MLPAIRDLDGAGRSYQANADLDLIVLEEGLTGKMVSAHRCTGGSFNSRTMVAVPLAFVPKPHNSVPCMSLVSPELLPSAGMQDVSVNE